MSIDTSPEALARGSPDPTFDLWALSVVLYESVTGRNPFERESLDSTSKAILGADLPDIRNLCADCPEPMRRFLESELSRSSNLRAQSAREFNRRLRKVETDLSALARVEDRGGTGAIRPPP